MFARKSGRASPRTQSPCRPGPTHIRRSRGTAHEQRAAALERCRCPTRAGEIAKAWKENAAVGSLRESGPCGSSPEEAHLDDHGTSREKMPTPIRTIVRCIVISRRCPFRSQLSVPQGTSRGVNPARPWLRHEVSRARREPHPLVVWDQFILPHGCVTPVTAMSRAVASMLFHRPCSCVPPRPRR